VYNHIIFSVENWKLSCKRKKKSHVRGVVSSVTNAIILFKTRRKGHQKNKKGIVKSSKEQVKKETQNKAPAMHLVEKNEK
jgi:hypothetical protein